MYAHQHTKEPGSAFYGPHGTVPGDPSASLLFRTVDFFALNNIFVPNANTAIAVRYGFNRFQDFGGNYPAFDAATLGFPSSLVSAMTFNTFPDGRHHRLQRRSATAVRAARRTSRRRPTRRSRGSWGATRSSSAPSTAASAPT